MFAIGGRTTRAASRLGWLGVVAPKLRALAASLPVLAVGPACRSEGDSAPQHPYDLEVLATEKCPLPTAPGASERPVLGVRVRLTGRAAEGVAANYFYASVLTRDGARYLAELPGCSPVLSGRPLAPGEKRDGYVNVPIPAHKLPKALAYAPPIGDRPAKDRTTEILLAKPEPEEEP